MHLSCLTEIHDCLIDLNMMELVNLSELMILVVPVNLIDLTILVIWVNLVDKTNLMDL